MYSSQHHISISSYRGERNLFTSYPEPIVINEISRKNRDSKFRLSSRRSKKVLVFTKGPLVTEYI